MRYGYFAIGVWHTKHEKNIGTLWRTANLYGAAFVFTVGARYHREASDTAKTPNGTPLLHFSDVDDLVEHLPWSCPLVGVELSDRAIPLERYVHRARAAYLLGAEDHGLPDRVLSRCHDVVQIEAANPWSMNVAVAGSIVVRDRYLQEQKAAAS